MMSRLKMRVSKLDLEDTNKSRIDVEEMKRVKTESYLDCLYVQSRSPSNSPLISMRPLTRTSNTRLFTK